MDCEQAQQLFDAYLNGELSGSLATELGAHRIHCADCGRALALLEVSGQIIAADRDPVTLSDDFAGRLLACVDSEPVTRRQRLRRGLYMAGPLAAAAVIVLALVGVFDGHDMRVAGEKRFRVERPDKNAVERSVEATRPIPAALSDEAAQSATQSSLLEDWVERTRHNIALKRQSGESLQKYLDMTILQWIDILESAKEGAAANEHFPGADVSPKRPVSESDHPGATVPVPDRDYP